MQTILSFTNQLTGVEIRLSDVDHALVVRRHWTDQQSGNPCFQTIGGFHKKGAGSKAIEIFKKAVTKAIDDPTEFAL